MNILKAGFLYFAIVFGAGFVLGPIRMKWLVPRFGTRTAELTETPIMIAVIIFAASWTVRRFTVPSAPARLIGIGFFALCLMLMAEFTLVLRLQGMSIRDYRKGRDPVSGTIYYLSLVLFAFMPLLVAPA